MLRNGSLGKRNPSTYTFDLMANVAQTAFCTYIETRDVVRCSKQLLEFDLSN